MTSEAITVEWRKSSRSGQDGSNGNCVEVAWRKMPRHRARQLPQRIGENIGEHQIERRALPEPGR